MKTHLYCLSLLSTFTVLAMHLHAMEETDDGVTLEEYRLLKIRKNNSDYKPNTFHEELEEKELSDVEDEYIENIQNNNNNDFRTSCMRLLVNRDIAVQTILKQQYKEASDTQNKYATELLNLRQTKHYIRFSAFKNTQNIDTIEKQREYAEAKEEQEKIKPIKQEYKQKHKDAKYRADKLKQLLSDFNRFPQYRATYVQLIYGSNLELTSSLKKQRAEAVKTQNKYATKLLNLGQIRNDLITSVFKNTKNTLDKQIEYANAKAEQQKIKPTKQKYKQKWQAAKDHAIMIDHMLQEFDKRNTDSGWTVIETEGKDKSYAELTIEERTFLDKAETQLKKDPTSFYNTYKLDRLNSKERYEAIKTYYKKRRKSQLTTGLGVGALTITTAGVAGLGGIVFWKWIEEALRNVQFAD